ncbi:MAG: ABC transporter ATP-binding protein/permease [Deltaproteobacteria bacterium]|nr:ABC transporter ATP-binding protein/permease [Deltaproteobacteria bacterium]
MGKKDIPVVKRSLFSWILPGNVKLQLAIVCVISVTVFARVFPLEMQKRIVNEAINLRKIDLLFTYCALYLAAVILSGMLKYLINVLQVLISQRTLAKMRKDLYSHILTLPLSFFRKTGSGLVVSSIVRELAAAGDFVGMALGVPITSILTLLAFAAYLFTLNSWLAMLSLSIYPFILLVVPLLQRKANQANNRRVDVTRDLSNKITESIAGIHEIHGNGAYHLENRKFATVIDNLLKIRVVWGMWRFGVKSTNNFFINLSPFLIFMIGGYLAIKGRLELGALVAFLSAQERLYGPWKELISFYQLYQDASVGYRKSMEYFDVPVEYEIKPKDRKPYELEGDIEVKDLSFITEDGIRLIEGVNFSLKAGEHFALVGFSGSGKSTLAQCVGQLYKYSRGEVLIGRKEVSSLTKSDIVRNVGIIAQSPFIFDGTIKENLLYSYSSMVDEEGNGKSPSMPDLDDLIEVIQQTGVFPDILRFGLNTMLDPDKYGDFGPLINRVRQSFQREFGESLAEYVEFFDVNKYLYFSSILENLIFGTPNKDSFTISRLPKNQYFLNFLDDADLTRPLLSLGAELSRQSVDILGNLPPEKAFFEKSPVRPEELDPLKALVERLRGQRLHQLAVEDREQLLTLALRFVPGRHKMARLPKMLEELILEGRAMFRERITRDDPGAITFFDISEYMYGQTILNNILFGKPKTQKQEAQEKIYQSIIRLLIEEDLLERIVEIGMQFEVGTKGDRLSGGQRQKIAIARAFLKSPRILIMDEATSALDNNSQARIQNQLDTKFRVNTTVIAVVHRLDITKNYDKVAVMKAGKIVEMGSYDELIEKKGVFYELVSGKRG